ncbi:MAG: ferritin-like domain-containing protein [Dehalococcoidia bacterium]|jgi:rubrerythrin
MAEFFRSGELYRIAMQMERTGLAYYMAMAEQSKDISTRAVYEYLASAEKRHLKTFRKLWNKTGKSAPPESYRGEYRKYIKALIKDTVFPSTAAAKSRAAKSGPSTALKTGIQSEKDSILFYTELLNLLPDPEKEAVKKILAEEKRHLRRLLDYQVDFAGCFK